jgi:hypothetical protein
MLINPADPKWLEILKASGWQTTALTIACGLVVVLVKSEVIPTTDSPLWIALPAIGALIFGCLSLAAMGSALAKVIKPAARFQWWRLKCHEERAVREFIPYMTDRDRAIIGYLLYHNQKMFQAEQDGGYAAPLISKGIIQRSGVPGQAVDLTWMPFEVPDHVWSVLEKNREAFPYEPPPTGEVKERPWAIPWMVR